MELTDLELVDATLAGDLGAFEELFRRYSQGVHSLALRMLRNDTEAQDIVQETFMSAFRKLSTFRRVSPFRAWLYRIATNACLMKLRSRRRRPEVPLEIRGPGFDDEGRHERPVVDWSPLVDRQLLNKELGEQIQRAVDDLPEKYRVVLILANYEHMSMKQIAAALELSVPNVKTRLHRARLAIRRALGEYIAGER